MYNLSLLFIAENETNQLCDIILKSVLIYVLT